MCCGLGADISLAEVGIEQACWRPPDSPDVAQLFDVFFFFKKLSMNL